MIEQTINIERMEDVVDVFGSFDENIKLVEHELGVTVVSRDDQLKISGEAENVMYAVKAVEGLLGLAARKESITEQNVRYIINLVKAGNEGNYSSLEDFDGMVVGAQMATTKADIVTNDMPGATPNFMSSVIDLVNALVYDQVDALILDGAVADQYLESNPDLAAVDIDLSGYVEPYRVWVPKDDPGNLLPSINETIARVLEDGTMDSFIAEANELSDQALEG